MVQILALLIAVGASLAVSAEESLDEALLRDPAALLREGQAAAERSDFAAAISPGVIVRT